MSLNVKIIGLGGIGSILSENLCRYLNYLREHQSTMTFIDGDEYETKNMERQVFNRFGNKAEVKQKELQLRFENLDFSSIPEYINADTVGDIVAEGDVIFVAVDNHKTRKVISDHASKMENIVIISGGNELTDGNVQLYVRKDGTDLTPKLTDYHPEIENPVDKSPDEMSCQELEASEPQLLFTNMSVATYMCQMFYNFLNGKHDCSEVYFDMRSMGADAKMRAVLS